jgi:uncharacterized phage-associated protein
MQIQKLAYIMHGWHLACTGEPLFSEPVEWSLHGPFIKSIGDHFRAFGSMSIVSSGFAHDFGQVTNLLLEKVWDAYKSMTIIELVAITRRVNSPWCRTVHAGSCVISNEVIREYYEELARNNCSSNHDRKTLAPTGSCGSGASLVDE